MKYCFFVLLSAFLSAQANYAYSQSSAQKEAVYMATLYAVLNQKMQDKDIEKDLAALREDKTFVKNLQKKLNKLSNDKNGNSKDRQIRKILEQAGKNIDNFL